MSLEFTVTKVGTTALVAIKGRIVAGPNAESLVADPLRPEARPAIVSQPSNRVRPNACSASNLFIASNFTWPVRAGEGAPSQ